MNRILILFSLSLFTLSGFSQTELKLNLSAKYHPQNFRFSNPFNMAGYEFLPIFGANSGIRYYLNSSQYFLEADLLYAQVRYYRKADWSAPEGSGGDIIIPRGNEYHHVSHYGGLKLGGGYALDINKKSRLLLSGGGELMLGLVSKWFGHNYKRFKGDNFMFGTFYGLYFRPTYSFSFSKEDNAHWYFSLFADTDLLFQGSNPAFLLGGGLGVTYRL